MDASTIALLTTSLLGVISAVAAAYNSVRKTEMETLRSVVGGLTSRVEALESDLEAERKSHVAERVAHSATRADLVKAYEDLRKCMERRARPATRPA